MLHVTSHLVYGLNLLQEHIAGVSNFRPGHTELFVQSTVTCFITTQLGIRKIK